MTSIGLEHYLMLSAVLFVIGLFGALTKRNNIAVLLCIEIMLNGVNVAMVAFSRYVVPAELTGQIFAIFIIAVGAAEAAVGLAIIMAVYRQRGTVDPTEIDSMKQ